MKSERRHELQHNQLADAIETWGEKLAPYSRVIAGVLVLLVVVAIGVGYVTNKGRATIQAGWDEYFEALSSGDRTKLVEIAETYAGTPVAPWARIVAADMALAEGTSQLFNQKTSGRELVQQAVDNYSSVLSDTDDPVLTQRGLFGLARGHESLGSLDDLNRARDDYQRLVDKYPEGIYTAAAKSRIADLEREPTKEFYDWFVKHETPRTSSVLGGKPEFSEESLDKLDMNIPSVVDAFKTDDKSKKKKDDSLLNVPLLPSLTPDSTPETKPNATPDSTPETKSEASSDEQPKTEPAPETTPSTEPAPQPETKDAESK